MLSAIINQDDVMRRITDLSLLFTFFFSIYDRSVPSVQMEEACPDLSGYS